MTMPEPRRVIAIITTVLVGLSAGFFVAYEVSVTVGLAEVDDVTYVHTFQAINATIRNVGFATIFFGSIPALGVAIAVAPDRSRRAVLVVAAIAYVTAVGVTATGNVPLNDDLAEVEVTTPESAAVARAEFEDDWNRLNLARTVLLVVSFATTATASATTRS